MSAWLHAMAYAGDPHQELPARCACHSHPVSAVLQGDCAVGGGAGVDYGQGCGAQWLHGSCMEAPTTVAAWLVQGACGEEQRGFQVKGRTVRVVTALCRLSCKAFTARFV